ncbi:hypothetical protein P9112_008806 [Eukaryota sp. TZLM1-RC]
MKRLVNASPSLFKAPCTDQSYHDQDQLLSKGVLDSSSLSFKLDSPIHSLSSTDHVLLLTTTGKVYGWGDNEHSQVFFSGPCEIPTPTKLPLSDVISISAGSKYSLALTSEGSLYAWGNNINHRISSSEDEEVSLTKQEVCYSLKTIFAGECVSLALTNDNRLIYFLKHNEYNLIEGVVDIKSVETFLDNFVAITSKNEVYFGYFDIDSLKYTVSKLNVDLLRDFNFSSGCFSLNSTSLFFIDNNSEVWELPINGNSVSVPVKIEGLTSVKLIKAGEGLLSAVSNENNVLLLGDVSVISPLYEHMKQPIFINKFNDINSIYFGEECLFGVSSSYVYSLGRNDKGQLGTGDLDGRDSPTLSISFASLIRKEKSKSVNLSLSLIQSVLEIYLQKLGKQTNDFLFLNAQFLAKCAISKRVVSTAKKLLKKFTFDEVLTDPFNLLLTPHFSKLELQFNRAFSGDIVFIPTITELCLWTNDLGHDQFILGYFPNLTQLSIFRNDLFNYEQVETELDWSGAINLNYIELHYPLKVFPLLPTSLLKLVINCVCTLPNLSYLESLKELVININDISNSVVEGKVLLPQSLRSLSVNNCGSLSCLFGLANLQELNCTFEVFSNINAVNFPSLQFIGLNYAAFDSELCPFKFKSNNAIKSVYYLKNGYLLELTCFPHWVQYPKLDELYNVLE